MNIVFMGTPGFARVVLSDLADNGCSIVACITGPDKKSGRGGRLVPTAVKREAEDRGLPVISVSSLRSRRLHDQMRALQPDLFVVVAFRILPESLYSIPTHGAINLHGSLLPRYRGAAPIHWALINGEVETGLTTFRLAPSVDTGAMLLSERVAITPDDTYDSLAERMARAGGPLVRRTIDGIGAGTLRSQPQDDERATQAPKLGPDDCDIDFTQPAAAVVNRVRGLATQPGAFSHFRGEKLKIYRVAPVTEVSPDYPPGSLLVGRRSVAVMCADHPVSLESVVPAGKRAMDGTAFKNGWQPRDGERLNRAGYGAAQRS